MIQDLFSGQATRRGTLLSGLVGLCFMAACALAGPHETADPDRVATSQCAAAMGNCLKGCASFDPNPGHPEIQGCESACGAQYACDTRKPSDPDRSKQAGQCARDHVSCVGACSIRHKDDAAAQSQCRSSCDGERTRCEKKR